MMFLCTLICLLLLSSPVAAGLDLAALLPTDRSRPPSAPRSSRSPDGRTRLNTLQSYTDIRVVVDIYFCPVKVQETERHVA